MSHVGPIVFANETARNQLLEGEVVTFRKSERTTGETWWRKSRTGTKEGDARVEHIDTLDPRDDDALEPYRELSGFETVDDWRAAMAELNGEIPDEGHLYRVTLPEQTLVTDGSGYVWDHENCPRDDCEGELQQQDEFNVLCLSCEDVWTHYNTGSEHILITPDQETVARKPHAATDGGLERFGVDCPDAEAPSDEHTERIATDTSDDYRYTRPQCRALTGAGDRCSNPIERGGSDEFCPRHADADDVETIDDHLETDGGNVTAGTGQENRTCECCGAECLPGGRASLNDPDGDWVMALVGAREYIPKGHGNAFLCQTCSPSDYLDRYEDEHGTRYADTGDDNSVETDSEPNANGGDRR